MRFYTDNLIFTLTERLTVFHFLFFTKKFHILAVTPPIFVESAKKFNTKQKTIDKINHSLYSKNVKYMQ